MCVCARARVKSLFLTPWDRTGLSNHELWRTKTFRSPYMHSNVHTDNGRGFVCDVTSDTLGPFGKCRTEGPGIMQTMDRDEADIYI